MSDIKNLVIKIFEKSIANDKQLKETIDNVHYLLENCEREEIIDNNIKLTSRLNFHCYTSMGINKISFDREIISRINEDKAINYKFNYEKIEDVLSYLFKIGKLNEFMTHLTEIVLPQFISGYNHPLEYQFI